MDRQRIVELIVRIMRHEFDRACPDEHVVLGAGGAELDSVEFVELFVALSEELDISLEIPDELLESDATVGSLADVLHAAR